MQQLGRVGQLCPRRRAARLQLPDQVQHHGRVRRPRVHRRRNLVRRGQVDRQAVRRQVIRPHRRRARHTAGQRHRPHDHGHTPRPARPPRLQIHHCSSPSGYGSLHRPGPRAPNDAPPMRIAGERGHPPVARACTTVVLITGQSLRASNRSTLVGRVSGTLRWGTRTTMLLRSRRGRRCRRRARRGGRVAPSSRPRARAVIE